MADRYAAQCNLVGVCIDDRKQCNSVAGGGGDVNPEMITVSSASTHRDVVDQANLKDAPDFASFDLGLASRIFFEMIKFLILSMIYLNCN